MGGVELLLKAHLGAGEASLSLAGTTARIALTPLMPNIERATPAGMGVAATPVWYLAKSEVEGINPWDLCHQVRAEGLGIAGVSTVAFAEPNLEQSWIWTEERRQVLSLRQSCDRAPNVQDTDVYATHPTDHWFRDSTHSQLDAARASVPLAKPTERVRIAHLDTGYDPDHSARPPLLRLDLARNFADDKRPDDAVDRPTALINPMFGHGTATGALLAGGAKQGPQIGGAPQCEVVPLRVANWVVLFKNSAIAAALDYVSSLWERPNDRVHVVTLSMGGVASAAWADAVNALYDLGVFVVTAAGNNFGHLPTRYTVYPARFRRVVAACGVMADGRPYADLPIRKMAGCYGPEPKQSASAIAAYTPNVPWAIFGCPDLVDWDGGGTSAATPQIAAAAALWIQRHKASWEKYPEGWMRVEAVRKALFDSAATVSGDLAKRLGRGMLRANSMLGVQPAKASSLRKEEPDSASFALLRVLTGLGLAQASSASARMLELEALQLSQTSTEIEALLGENGPDDPELATSAAGRRILEALADDGRASRALKAAIARRPGAGPSEPRPSNYGKDEIGPGRESSGRPPAATAAAGTARIAAPPARSLRVFAFDPLLGTSLDTMHINEAVLKVRWEQNLKPGPVGEYLEVIDVDPASDRAYLPVDLNQPEVLGQDGIAPTEGNPQFHQQMVYAVAMRTIEHFEHALGRAAQWAERVVTVRSGSNRVRKEWRFVRRLRIYPHALREANAYYSPEKIALLFGYFNAPKDDVGRNMPGGLIFNCLSHDIVAHETTHALLDGLHPYYKEATNTDMLAFHEAFADIVAIFQHFGMPEALRDQIAKARGSLDAALLLGGLAMQFGESTGERGALRSAIARYDRDQKRWVPRQPSQSDYLASDRPHQRGAVLVAAIFDAFIQVYRRRTDDLIRLATGGTGILPDGAISHDLVERLAEAASTIAGHMLAICIRALDYCPPVDLTFGEYLRAVITADRDLVPDDRLGYRVALISAFRAHGIFPVDVPNLSVDALVWQEPELQIDELATLVKGLTLAWKANRYEAYRSSNADAKALHQGLIGLPGGSSGISDAVFAALGLFKTSKKCAATLDGQAGEVSGIEMHSVRPAQRVGPDGRIVADVIIEMTQAWMPKAEPHLQYRGGCTIVYDLGVNRVRYIVRKRVGNAARVNAQRHFRVAEDESTLRSTYFADRQHSGSLFAMLHRHV